jgi:hypothetical protein
MNLRISILGSRDGATPTLHRLLLVIGAAFTLGTARPALAVTNDFFNPSQTATLIVTNIDAVTIQSGDYR